MASSAATHTLLSMAADVLLAETKEGDVPPLDLLLEVFTFRRHAPPPDGMAPEGVATWRADQLSAAAAAMRAPD
eukprot:4606388-Prymnesium_polylepis.1